MMIKSKNLRNTGISLRKKDFPSDYSVPQVLLLSLVIVLIVITLFIPWWSYKEETFMTESDFISGDPDITEWYDYGLTSYSRNVRNVNIEYIYSNLYYYDSSESDSSGSFFIITFILVLFTLVIAIIIYILLVLKSNGWIDRKVDGFIIIPMITSYITLLHFFQAFPITGQFSGLGFYGSIKYEVSGNIFRTSWAPTLGFYLFIVIFIILLIQTVLSIVGYSKEVRIIK